MRAPEAWLDRVERTGSGAAAREPLGAAEQATEMLLMGLRLAEGIETARYEALAGRPLPRSAITELEESGLLVAGADRIRVTSAGRPVLEGVLRRLLFAQDDGCTRATVVTC